MLATAADGREAVDLCQLIPRQAALDAQNGAGQNPQRGSKHAIQPRHSLRRRGSAQDVVPEDLAFAEQSLLIVEERFGLDHVRGQ